MGKIPCLAWKSFVVLSVLPLVTPIKFILIFLQQVHYIPLTLGQNMVVCNENAEKIEN